MNKTPHFCLSLATMLALGFNPSATLAADGPSYHLVKEIAVGGPGSWDYLSVDAAARRLYVSHGTKAVVIDLDKDEVAGEITDTPGIHGIALAPELGLAFTSNGRENKASVVDLKTLQTKSRIETGANPDAILFDPSLSELYTFNGRGSSATVIDAKGLKVITTIQLGGKPEFAVLDAKAGRIYNNLEDKSETLAIDTKTHQVVNRWPIAPGKEPSALAIDEEHHRLFIGCGNQIMAMMDSTSGKVITTVPIGNGVDACSFDSGAQLAFSSCADGTVTIAHEDSPEKLSVVQSLKTEPGAKTMTLDPKTHRIYLGAGSRNAPNSFKILVFAPK